MNDEGNQNMLRVTTFNAFQLIFSYIIFARNKMMHNKEPGGKNDRNTASSFKPPKHHTNDTNNLPENFI